MANIKILKENELVGGTDNTPVYPVSSTQAIYCQDSSGNVPSGAKPRLEDRLKDIENSMEAQGYVILNEKTIHVGNKSITVPDKVSQLANDLGYLSLTDPVNVNGQEYVDLGLPSGALWAKCNVGASSETGYGNYYQFGKGSKTYNESWSEEQYSSSSLALSDDTARVVMGGDWKTPSTENFQELFDNTTHQWVTDYNNSGINGYTFTANNQTLFIPAAGSWSGTSTQSDGASEIGELTEVNTKAILFTSSSYQPYSAGVPVISLNYEAYTKQFSSSGVATFNISYSTGCSIRGIIVPQKSSFKEDLDSSLASKANTENVYSKSAIDSMLETIRQGRAVIVDELPEASADTLDKIYLIERQDSEENNVYDEYITIISRAIITPSTGGGSSVRYIYAWEKVGSTNISLADYYTQSEINTLLAEKQAVIEDLSTIRSGATAGSTAYQKPSSGISANDMNTAVQNSLAKAESALQNDTLYFDSNGNSDYIEIGGIKWATKNLGASSIIDAGLYFQWGDVQGYTAAQAGTDKTFDFSDYKYTEDSGTTMTKYNSTDDKAVLDASDDAAVSINKGTWRMPTKEDFQALEAACTIAWTNDYNSTGVAGLTFTDSSDNTKVLFLPAGGHGETDSILETNTMGIYWTSTLYSYSDSNSSAYTYMFGSSIPYTLSNTFRGYGFTIRPILDDRQIKKYLDSKVDKVEDAVSGNLAVLTSDGNIADSGLALSTKTAYSNKGSATKVPKISTNTLGQVTSISEVTITQPTVPDISTSISSDGASDTKTASPKAVKTYVDTATAGIVTSSTTGLKIEVVASLPANPDSNTIYIVQ